MFISKYFLIISIIFYFVEIILLSLLLRAGIKLEKFVETKCKELNLPFKKSDQVNSSNKKPQRRTN